MIGAVAATMARRRLMEREEARRREQSRRRQQQEERRRRERERRSRRRDHGEGNIGGSRRRASTIGFMDQEEILMHLLSMRRSMMLEGETENDYINRMNQLEDEFLRMIVQVEEDSGEEEEVEEKEGGADMNALYEQLEHELNGVREDRQSRRRMTPILLQERTNADDYDVSSNNFSTVVRIERQENMIPTAKVVPIATEVAGVASFFGEGVQNGHHVGDEILRAQRVDSKMKNNVPIINGRKYDADENIRNKSFVCCLQ
jgi:hypothetical protein